MAVYRYCPLCTTPLEERQVGHGTHQVCPQCGFVNWNNSKPCAGGLVIQEGKVLLVKRGIEPYKGYWDIPGGFLDSGEDPKEGVRRELREETGLEVYVGDLLDIIVDIYGDRTKAQHPGELDYTLNIYYLAEPTGGTLRPADDAVDFHWFPLNELPPDSTIAFENGRAALHALREHISDSQTEA